MRTLIVSHVTRFLDDQLRVGEGVSEHAVASYTGACVLLPKYMSGARGGAR